MNIAICLAHNYPAFERLFAMSLMRMMNYFYEWNYQEQAGHNLSVITHGGYQLDKMRDAVTVEAINNEADILLYLDTDMEFPQETIVRLFHVLKDNPEFHAVSGLYVSKNKPYLPQIFTKFDNKKRVFIRPIAFPIDGPFQIEGAGAGIMMVWADVIKKLKPPYFKFVYKGEDKYLTRGLGEDLYFCWKMKKAKFKMICDPVTSCGHIGQTEATLSTFVKHNGFKVKDKQIYVTKKQLQKIEKEVAEEYKGALDYSVKKIRAKKATLKS